MQEVDVEALINKSGSTYKLVILTSIRAIELSEGAAPLVSVKVDAKCINTALREISEGKVSYTLKEEK